MHTLMILQPRQQLGRNQEIPTRVRERVQGESAMISSDTEAWQVLPALLTVSYWDWWRSLR